MSTKLTVTRPFHVRQGLGADGNWNRGRRGRPLGFRGCRG